MAPPRGTFVRTTEPTETVTLLKGDTASARMSTPAERRELDIGEGVPVLVVFRADGSRELTPLTGSASAADLRITSRFCGAGQPPGPPIRRSV